MIRSFSVIIFLVIGGCTPPPQKPVAEPAEEQGTPDLTIQAFIPPVIFAGTGSDSDYMLVKDGVDRQSFIRITNSNGRRLSADYDLVSGTAIEGQDFRLDQTGPIELGAGQFADIPVTAIAESPPHFNRHETFEILSRDAAYRFWSPREHVEDRLAEYSSLRGLGYWVDDTFDAGFGFQAIGLTSHEFFTMNVTWRDSQGNAVRTQEQRIWIFDLDRPPILAIRGTEPSSIQDWLSNAAPEGVGYSQFVANQGAVNGWLAKVSDPRQGDFRFRPHVTGHSLGGAVSQWIASWYTWNGGLLGEIVTFNSPGIAVETAHGDGVKRFRSDRADAVTHYITGGDIVSLFGERYLPGSFIQSFSTPSWAHTIYTAGPDSVFNFDHKDYKHSVPVLTDFIEKNGKRWDRPVGRIDEHFDNQILNDPFFSYVSPEHRDADYFGFLQMVARHAALQPALGPALAAVLNYRFSMEASRAEVARLLYSLPVLLPTQIVLRAWRAAQVWKAQAWHFIDVMTKDLLGSSNRLNKGGVSAEPANFWEASARWPAAAWEASETWPDHAWEVMASWRPQQWAATIPVDFPWAETPHWSRSDWEKVEPVQTRSFSGSVFEDLDGDGVRDPGEPGLAGETIFIDLDGGGALDGNDLQTGSSGDGRFALVTSTLSAGSYPLGIVLPGDNWVVTAPAPPTRTHILILDTDPGQRIEGLDFGIRCASECRVIPDERPGEETIAISDEAFLRTYTDVPRESLVDTGIRASDFACGVMGFAATGGKIYNNTDGWSTNPETGQQSRTRLIEVSLRSHSGRWHLVGGFRTIDDRENWDRISILCVSTAVASSNGPLAGKPIFRQQFQERGDNLDYDTGISSSRYACGIGGFRAFGGDINENGRGTIQKTFLDGTSGRWRLLADFRTHNNHETWSADVLCFDREIASVDGPLPGKRYFIKSFKRLGDNIDYDTGIAFDQWVCGVTGFQIRSGDIDEGGKGKGTSLIQAYAHAKNGRWHLRADFRSHRDHEDWDVDVLCAARGGLPPDLKRNVSRKERGLQHCSGESMSCQVLVNELLSVTGFVRVLGGGFEGSPSRTAWRCADKSAVEVYVNDRDARGSPQWSAPDFCVSNNATFQLSPHNTYDLRSTSVVGAEPARFELLPANALLMTGATAKDFPAPYGPGIALTWKPSTDARLRFYEIQYSFDELNWEIYTDSRDAFHGGWINHHGNIAYQEIDKALPPGWTYFYRVRALDATGNAFTPWSNVVAGTVRHWNQRPRFDAIPNQRVGVNDLVQFDVAVSDPEGMADLQLEATQLPAGTSFTPVHGEARVSGRFTWVTNESDVGVHRVTFAAKDALGATATRSAVIIVGGFGCGVGQMDCLP